MQQLNIPIAGKWRLGTGERLTSYNPADGSINAQLHAASIDDVNEAIEAAEKAWQAPNWYDCLPHQRALILYRVSELILQKQEELARLQTRDNGKPISETRALVASAAYTAKYFAAACEVLEGEITTPRQPNILTMSLYEPLGVIAAITPWNSPIASEMQKIAPALAAGNAVIIKPAEATPLLALKLVELFEQAGLPKGLLSVLPGKGSIIGEAIVRHPLVKKISFTGGTSTGRYLAHIAADKLIPTSLELGGKSPTIVLANADLEQAARGVVYGIYSSAGQACIAGSRLFIHHSLYIPLIERISTITRQLRIGSPEQQETHIGPLISMQHRQQVANYVQLAQQEGGRITFGGEIPADQNLLGGSYYLPTLIEGLTNKAQVCRDEIFGPVLVAMPFSNEAELVEMANDSVYGLAAGIWGTNIAQCIRLARRLEVGTVWINTYKIFSVATPFGGYKESGIGREKGINGIKAYMQQKSVYLNLLPSPNLWSD